jgi:putative transcriptional regulator
MVKRTLTRTQAGRGYLDGHFLIAMPGMADDRFARSVVYICAHSSEGAMGITINRAAPQITFRELLVQLDIIPKGDEIRLPEPVKKMTVHRGGPVETGRGFVLHSADYFIENSTLPIDEHVSLTATLEILKAIAAGHGPASSLLALGYAGWAPGQLETEIQANGWLNCPAAPEVIFDADLDAKYERAMAMIGIDPSRLTAQAGHA